jgi:hypothetical protein
MRASNAYAMGFMYDIHLNHGCIDGRGMMSYVLSVSISPINTRCRRKLTSGIDNQR